MILPCTCTHKIQDQYYGKGQRVHTPINKNAGKPAAPQWRCTVCKGEK